MTKTATAKTLTRQLPNLTPSNQAAQKTPIFTIPRRKIHRTGQPQPTRRPRAPTHHRRQGVSHPKALQHHLRKHRNKARPRLEQHIDKQGKRADNTKNLEELPRVSRPHLGLEERLLPLGEGVGGAGREAAGGDVLFQEGVLLVPALAQPVVKGLLGVQRDVGHTEAAPVEVDRLGRLAADVGAGEGEDLFSKLAAAGRGSVSWASRG